MLDGGQVGIEELAQVFGDLLGGDVLIQLLPDAFGIALIGFDDPIDGAVDGFGKQLLDVHCCDPWKWK